MARLESRYSEAGIDQAVSRLLRSLGVCWGDLIAPGDRVLLKPNFIRESHTRRPGEWEQIITHGTVIGAVATQIAAAMGGTGTITIADAPQTDSDFERICERAGLRQLQERIHHQFPGLVLEVLDLRREVWQTRNGVVVERRRLPEDPRGYTKVNLGRKSCFHGVAGRFYGADYDTGLTAAHHTGEIHEYLLSRTAMDADLFINLPKLKTHKKVGVTLSLKNLVGINGDKNFLPHFRVGTPDEGGDEFPESNAKNKLQSRTISLFKEVARRTGPAARFWAPLAKRAGSRIFGDSAQAVRSGNWYGNDTTWRMTLDLNKALFHFDGEGRPRTKKLKYLSIVDGVIAGEGDGPMEADPKECGLMIAGANPVAVDYVATALMGFDWLKVPSVREAFCLAELLLTDFSPEDIEIVPEMGKPFRFQPHFGWVGHIESSAPRDVFEGTRLTVA